MATAAFLNGSCENRRCEAGQGGGMRRWCGPGKPRKVEEGGETARGGMLSSGGCGRRADALDADRVRQGEEGGGGGGLRVDPSKSLGSFSKLNLLPACDEQGLCFGVSHPGECLASGRFSEESNTGEK